MNSNNKFINIFKNRSRLTTVMAICGGALIGGAIAILAYPSANVPDNVNLTSFSTEAPMLLSSITVDSLATNLSAKSNDQQTAPRLSSDIWQNATALTITNCRLSKNKSNKKNDQLDQFIETQNQNINASLLLMLKAGDRPPNAAPEYLLNGLWWHSAKSDSGWSPLCAQQVKFSDSSQPHLEMTSVGDRNCRTQLKLTFNSKKTIFMQHGPDYLSATLTGLNATCASDARININLSQKRFEQKNSFDILMADANIRSFEGQLQRNFEIQYPNNKTCVYKKSIKMSSTLGEARLFRSLKLIRNSGVAASPFAFQASVNDDTMQNVAITGGDELCKTDLSTEDRKIQENCFKFIWLIIGALVGWIFDVIKQKVKFRQTDPLKNRNQAAGDKKAADTNITPSATALSSSPEKSDEKQNQPDNRRQPGE